ncbi:MAG TPA: bifunctional riboflavin kinase/FMN adenylyltransferase [Chitinophagaceae bacterium]|jgi:riboflavin kinase/FMN adenylyltransferase|nr:bifunctional riboflavin kinase/FMN adenylyltransferase [Chitinophagaceae bacterium]
MKVYRNIEQLPAFRNAVITIGTFDGVHEGHRKIIVHLKQEAETIGGETVIVTFHPHPRKVVSSPILGIRLINTLDEKIELLADAGIDHLVIIPFTEAFANQSAEGYIQDFLMKNFRPHTIIIGYDHRFGKDRLGDYRLLEKMAPVFNYVLKEIPKHVLDEIAISSTNIREAIVHSDIETANKLLGYEFFFQGIVVDGDKLGRKLGYPTANLKMTDEEKIVLGNGIYAVYVEMASGEWQEASGKNAGYYESYPPLTTHRSPFKGMMSIGFRPTVDGKKKVIEVNIFDFDKEIYGKIIRVYVKKYLRPETKFNDLDELVRQIDLDKIESLKVL